LGARFGPTSRARGENRKDGTGEEDKEARREERKNKIEREKERERERERRGSRKETRARVDAAGCRLQMLPPASPTNPVSNQ